MQIPRVHGGGRGEGDMISGASPSAVHRAGSIVIRVSDQPFEDKESREKCGASLRIGSSDQVESRIEFFEFLGFLTIVRYRKIIARCASLNQILENNLIIIVLHSLRGSRK